jgi:hypothetical protein
MNTSYHRENVLTAIAKASEAMGDNPEGLRHLADLKRLIAAPPDTPVTVALDADPRGVSVGVWQGSQCIYTGAHDLPAPADRSQDWKAIEAAVDEYLDSYELRLDEGCHTPSEFERFLLSDAIAGMLAENEILALLAGRPAPATGDAQALPELNADLISILGRPNFTCIRLAQLLRLSGVDIATKAENEQATVIHYLLGFYLKHGSQWAEKAGEDIERLRRAAIAAQQGKGGAA